MSETLLKQAGSFFQAESKQLQAIMRTIKRLKECNDKIALFLEPHIKKYCYVANVSQEKLVIIAANGSIATQIRLQEKNLLRDFKKDPVLQHIKEIHCKVSPKIISPAKTQKPTKKIQFLSPEFAQIVQEIAESLSDPKLREIMLRIASHIK